MSITFRLESGERNADELARERGLEGIVAKHKHASYVSGREGSSWIKIKNRSYSQIVGRDGHFERIEKRRESDLPAGEV